MIKQWDSLLRLLVLLRFVRSRLTPNYCYIHKLWRSFLLRGLLPKLQWGTLLIFRPKKSWGVSR